MVLTGTLKTKAVRTSYPKTTGLTAETTRTYDRKINLVPTMGSTVAQRRKKGL